VLSLLEGNREELSGLIKESLRYFPDQLETIKNSIRERNARELSKSAHKIKGSFSSFDAKRCFELALELENIGREQSFEDADITYRMLVSETARLKEYLLNFL
jgi:HPt (histidine-containing phosphotransfer) domain-containing protein